MSDVARKILKLEGKVGALEATVAHLESELANWKEAYDDAHAALEANVEPRCPHGFRTDGSTNCPFCLNSDWMPVAGLVQKGNYLVGEKPNEETSPPWPSPASGETNVDQ
jgi:hypothetical protein